MSLLQFSVFIAKLSCEVKCNKVPVIVTSFAIIYCNSRFYCKTGCEVKCNKFSVIATSFAIIYCNTGLRYIDAENFKIQCCLR